MTVPEKYGRLYVAMLAMVFVSMQKKKTIIMTVYGVVISPSAWLIAPTGTDSFEMEVMVLIES